MSKKPKPFSAHEQAVMALSEAIESLEPLAQLLCASRLMRVGYETGSFARYGDVGGAPDGISLELCDGWPLLSMWASQKGSASEPRTLSAWLGDKEVDQWSPLFVALAFKAQIKAEKIAAAGWESAMEVLNIKAVPAGRCKILGLEMCSQWLANAAISSEPLEQIRRQAKIDGFKIDQGLDAVMEAREIGKFASNTESDSAAGSGPRL